MTQRLESERRSVRPPLLRIGAMLLVVAAMALAGSWFLSHPASAPVLSLVPVAPSSASPPTVIAKPVPTGSAAPLSAAPEGELALGSGRAARLGQADGLLPARTTARDVGFPGIAGLDPQLLAALRRATDAAAGRSIEVFVTSGWRSLAYQTQLFDQAVSKYGSPAKAAMWVAPPGASAHESGAAVDIGPQTAVTWLAAHGSMYGLCQVYRNEPWHFELRLDAVGHGCPPLYADATHDPRLEQ